MLEKLKLLHDIFKCHKKTFAVLFSLSFFVACNPKKVVTINDSDESTDYLSGTLEGYSATSSSLGSQSVQASSTVYSFACSSPQVDLYKVDNNGDRIEPAIATTELASNGTYKFNLKNLKEYFEGTKPKVAMVTKVTGCSSGIYMRPITGTQNQKISMGSSLLGYMLSSSAKQQVASAIKNSPGDIDNLLTKISSATTVADAYSQLTASTSGASQFASLFGTQATTLGDAAPTVDTLVMPEEGQERSALAYSVTAKHWLTSYSIVYEWQVDNVTVSTAANFTYTPALNSRGTHTISLKVGKDNGSGHVDTTKAYYSVSKSLLISINDAPTVRSLIASVNSGSYSTGQVITLTVRFSENVTVTGTPRLSLNTTPTTRVLNMTSSSGTDLVFSYTVNAGENSSALDAVSAAGLDANGGTIKDDADNNAVLALPVPGAANSISVSKTIKIDTTAPSVTISANPAAVVSSSSASFTFAATDAGTVNGYQCKVDSGSYAACSSPKTFSGLSAGAHTFYVTASDIAGNTSAAQTVSWTIDKTGPTTTISSAPAAVISSTSASLSFSAVDSGGGTVASYQCQIDGAAYATCVSPKSYTGLSQGSHTFYVRAVDSVGNTGTAVTSTWSADTVAPTVSSLQASVANGNYGYGQAMDITLTFNEIVTVTGTPQLTLNSGAVLSLTSSSGTTLTFNYVVGNGQNTSALDSASTSALSLNGGTIVDQAGNAATLTLPVVGVSGSISYAQTIVIDTTAPAAPNIYLTSPDLAQSTSITMTAANCTDRAYLYVTESVSEVPLGSESSWQACTTTASAIRYWLLNNTVGLRPLYIWAKDAAGNISASAKTIPLKYVPKLILGQDDANTITNLQTGLYAPVDIKYFGNKFYVVNGGAATGALAKVSVYNSIPSTTLATPDYYIGQKVGNVYATPGTANNRANAIYTVESDGTRFVAVDRNNNRVLIWNSIPANGDVAADLVLGQPDFTSSAINAGLGANTNLLTCKEINSPTDAKIYGNKLVVTDNGNNRILIWNTWPTSNYQAADLVLGQAGCSTYATTPVSASSLANPSGLVILGSKLAVADNLNHRILIWNTFPTSNGQAADLYLGQSSFTANASNSGGASATSLRNPRRLATDGTNLIVSDGSNHRVKIWNTFPTTNNAAANVVVGQTSMTGVSVNAATTASAATLNGPNGIQVIAGDLWIADNGNNRVLKYSGIPSTNGASATYVLGQQFLTKNVMSLSSGVNEQTFNRPIDTEFVGNALYITSYGHNRMSSYSSIPSGSNPQMELQWGQADFNSEQGNRGSTATAANTLSGVSGILYAGGTLYVADASNSRILGFASLPSTAATSASFALGQANLTTGTSNGGGAVSASTLYYPRQIASDGNKFAAADSSNNRVLIWNSLPSSTAQAADVVVGQPDMISNTANNGGISAASLNTPYGVALAENKLIVGDYGNNRLLIWDPIPTVSGTPATYVIGQANFTSNKYYTSSLNNLQRIIPYYVNYKNGKIFVADALNYSVKIWDQIPSADNQPATRVFGNSLSADNTIEYPAQPTENLLSQFYSAKSDGARMFIAEYQAHRVNVVPIPEESVTSEPNTKNRNITVSVHDCTNRSAVLLNESTVPSAGDASWQTCTTTASAITYQMSAGDGLKTIKVWYKDSDGNVLPNSHTLNVWLVTSYPGSVGGVLNVSSPTNSATVTFDPSSLFRNGSAVRFYISESSTAPTSGSSWLDYDQSSLPYTLTNQTDGTKTIYIWGMDGAGNISSTPISYTYIYDASPPTAPTTSLDGYYVSTYGAVMRLTVSSCADAAQIAVTETNSAPASGATSWATCSTTAQATTYTFTGATEGNHTLYVWAKDTAGNISTAGYQITANFNTSVVVGQADADNIATASGGFANLTDITSDDGTHFAIADMSNGRVLLYNGDPTQNSPSVVLGQTSMTKVGCAPGGTTNASNLCDPYAVLLVPVGGGVTKLIVADYSQSRVLIWNTLPTTNNQAADVVIGQPDMSSSTSNNGGRTCARLANPIGLASDGTRLLIADMSNLRVLMYNTIPTTNGATADVVIGQASCTVATSATTQAGMKNPYGVHISGNQIVVADRNNNRVLLYNSIPTANTPSADYVVGQSTFTASSTGITAATMNAPWRAYIWGGKLYVSDTGNNRTLIWNTVPSSNGASANTVLGQANLTSNTAAFSQAGAYSPRSIWLGSSYLWTAEYTAMRVKRYPLASLATGMNADAQVGGPADYTTSGVQNMRSSATTTQSSLTQPDSAIIVGTKLIVADYRNSRVLIWNTLPTSNNQNADVVLGQPSFTATTPSNGGITSSSLNLPVQVASDGTRLIVADRSNNRVLIWNTIPTVSNTAANLVLGQANFTSNSANRGGSIASNTMSAPFGIYTDGTRLYVTDEGNNRVLVWTTFPTVSGQAADFELGQAGFTTGSANRGGSVAANTLNAPRGVIEASSKLFVADMTNNRVLVWNSIPSANGTAADVAIGQASLTANTAGSSATVMSSPYHVKYLNSKLFVTDSSNRRIMIYNSIPTASGATVDSIIGQNSAGTVNINRFGVSSWAYGEQIADILYSSGYFWITDINNHRLLKVSIP